MADKNMKKRVTFKFYNPEAREVMLAGSFNAWSPAARPLKKDAKGIWKTTMMLPNGAHEYRFIVDGEWLADPDCVEKRMNEFGSHNSVIVI